jgi:sulfate adenylyltransferase subunit 2
MSLAEPYLRQLEDEAIYILREAVGERERPVLLFSGGKDSLVLLRLAEKAFRPAQLPFPLLHIDTGHNFPEVLAFRDEQVARSRARLLVASVEQSIASGRAVEAADGSRNRLQSVTLLDALAEQRFDVAFGGARRDEDRARAKERIVSVRDAFGQWEPKNQRPELWDLLNLSVASGQHLRVFPLSNWTELDIWHYIKEESLPLPSIYFAHHRQVLRRSGMLYARSALVPAHPGEPVEEFEVRFRTVGDMTCTGAVQSAARTVDAVIDELLVSTITERGATRGDDRFSEAAMEDRKREGYF